MVQSDNTTLHGVRSGLLWEMERIKSPGEMDFSTTDSISVSEKWRTWKQTMELYLTLALSDKSEKEQCCTFLYLIGQTGRDIYNTMRLADKEVNKIDVLFRRFEDYCRSKQNVTMERFKFNTRSQAADETINQYVTALKLLARSCSIGVLEDELIRDRVVCGILSERVQQRLLREQDLTLDKAMSICQAEEESQKQMKLLGEEGPETGIHTVRRLTPIKSSKEISPERERYKQFEDKQWCDRCGLSHRRGQCPAYGKRCFQCGGMNHFSTLCRTRKVSAVTRGKSHAVGGVNKTDRETNSDYLRNLCVNGSSVKFKVDTGSQANIIPWTIFKILQYTPKLKPTKSKLVSYSGDTIPTLGCCKLKCEDKFLEFFVIEMEQSPILSFRASEELGLIRTVMGIGKSENIVQRFNKVFEGLGCLATPYHISVDSSIQPVVCPL